MFGGNQNPPPFGGGGFGQSSGQQQSNPFGQTTQSQPFGQTTQSQPFGQTTQSQTFGQTTQSQTFGQMAAQNPVGFGGGSESGFGTFGSTPGSAFASSSSQPGSGFGSTQAPFGSSSLNPTRLFGSVTSTAATTSAGFNAGSSNLFGGSSTKTTTTTTGFGGGAVFGGASPATPATAGGFGSSSSVFGNTGATGGFSAGSAVFGASNQRQQQQQQHAIFGGGGGSSGSSTVPPLFGGKAAVTTTSSGGGSAAGGGLFGKHTSQDTSTSGSLFGKPTGTGFNQLPATTGAATAGSNLFGATATGPGKAPHVNPSYSPSVFSSKAGIATATRQQPPPTVEQKYRAVVQPAGVPASPPVSTPAEATSPPFKAKVQPAGIPAQPPLFGKSPPAGAPAVGMFGKVAASSSQSSAPTEGLFRKAAVQPAGVPAKPLVTAPAAGLFGKSSEAPAQPPGGLFGKPAATSSASSEAAVGRKASTSPAFRRAASSASDDSLHAASKVALKVTNIPPTHFNRIALDRHFRRYGNVTKVMINAQKKTATVHFASHDDALHAKRKGRPIGDRGQLLAISWGTAVATPTTAGGRPAVAPGGKLPGGEAGLYDPRTAATPLGTLFRRKQPATKDAVDDELASMAGTDDVSAQQVRLLRRPDERVPTPPVGGSGNRFVVRPGGGGGSRATSPKPTARAPSPKPGSRAASPAPPGGERRQEALSLRALGSSVANTPGERYAILENRDKIIRTALGLDRKKYSGVQTAKALKGTCPDMCPEKERYVREDRRRLSVYEMLAGTDQPGENPRVDHALAVKEYSRSSADQDVPLPGELRPAPVLERTMTYLMARVMDRGRDGEWAEWYEFLWSRTRGIRKDITQQQLLSPAAVSLVERCARWHVYCAARLCEEDMMTFDEKINNENLTKCLQTLKELYFDLEKKGVKCENEAEFRAYLVLMNLNEGDILRETQQLSEDLRESPQVKFVVRVFYALNSNNYVKFFKLVRQATFLNACIMMRYFNQVRNRALWTMLKAYTPKLMFPLADLVRLLGFEDAEHAASFCRHHALAVTIGDARDNAAVVLDKAAFVEPEASLPPRRAQTVVEAKQGGRSVGEVVNGAPLPPFTLHQPASSFNEHGRFIDTNLPVMSPEPKSRNAPSFPTNSETGEKAGATESAVVAAGDDQSEASSHAVAEATEEGERQIVIPNDVVKEVAKELFVEVIGELSGQLAGGLVRAARFYLNQAAGCADDFLDHAMPGEIRSVAESALVELRSERAESEARERAELSLARAAATQAAADALVAEVVMETCQRQAQQTYRDVRAELREQSLQRVTDALITELVEETVTAETQEIADATYTVDVVQRLQTLSNQRRAVELIVCGRFFRRWKNRYAAVVRQHVSMLHFPPGPSLLPLEEQLQRLLPDSQGAAQGALHLGHGCHLTLQAPHEVIEAQSRNQYSLAARGLLSRLQRDRLWEPINLGHLLRGHLPQKHADATRKGAMTGNSRSVSWTAAMSRQYWKLVVSLPETDRNHGNEVSEWVKAKLRRGTVPNADSQLSEVLSLYTLPAVTTTTAAPPLSVCVRAVVGGDHSAVRSKRHLHGTRALLVVLGQTDTERGSAGWWASEAARVASLASSLPHNPPVPMLVLVPAENSLDTTDAEDESLDQIAHHLTLDTLVSDGAISEYTVRKLPLIEDGSTDNTLSLSLVWLIRRSPFLPRVHSQPLARFLDDAVQREFTSRVDRDLATRRRKGLLHHPPDVLIGLYNAVIEHLASIVASDSLHQLSWPVTEFASEHTGLPGYEWNSARRLRRLTEAILACRLPAFIDDDDEGWDAAWVNTAHYMHSLARHRGAGTSDAAAIVARLACVFGACAREFGGACARRLRVRECEPQYENAPWTDVVAAATQYMVDTVANDNAEGDDLCDPSTEVTVFYLEDDNLPTFDLPQFWEDVTRDDRQDAETSTLDDTMFLSVTKKRLENSLSLGARPLAPRQAASISLDLTPPDADYMQVCDLRHSLHSALHDEKQRSARFEEFLMCALDGGGDNIADDIAFLSPIVTAKRRNSEPSRLASSSSRKRSRELSSDELGRSKSERKSTPSAEETLGELQHNVTTQRNANKMFELKLQAFLTDTF